MLLIIPLIVGSIIGVQVGHKVGQYLPSSHLKTLFAMLLCAVSVAIAYDTFFSEGDSKNFENDKLNFEQLNSFSQFIINFSNDSPFFYSASAILLAITLGVFGAGMRRILSKYKYLFLLKTKTGVSN
tara:strand:- start:353 stop:733 length:381 start_codon:yes stop_codon:yes gene_type:complete